MMVFMCVRDSVQTFGAPVEAWSAAISVNQDAFPTISTLAHLLGKKFFPSAPSKTAPSRGNFENCGGLEIYFFQNVVRLTLTTIREKQSEVNRSNPRKNDFTFCMKKVESGSDRGGVFGKLALRNETSNVYSGTYPKNPTTAEI
jgi:hypothetical protein